MTTNQLLKLSKLKSIIAIIPPVYATLNLGPQGDDFSTLTDVSATSVISGAVSLVLLITTVVFFFILILGAFKWITSNGDEKKVASARSQITNALIGLALIFSVWAMLNLLEIIFGINILEGLSIPSFTNSTNHTFTDVRTTAGEQLN